MIVPQRNRVLVYSQLFKDGVLVAKKDFFDPKHMDIENVPNLHVIKLMQSMVSRGYVKEQFSWQYYYYFLTDSGIDYLRGYLNLPSEIIPATLKKTATKGPPGGRMGGDRPGGRYGERGPGKKMGPGGEFRPEFRGGGGPRGGNDGYRAAPPPEGN